MVYKEGRHFVLHLMKFVYQITGRRLPDEMQSLLDEFPIDKESNFSVNITKAVMIFANEYMDFGADLVDITSPQFQAVLNSVKVHGDFLEFLGYYALKCISESKDQSDSPAIFLTSITNYLEGIKNMVDYWEELDKAAARIVVRDLEMHKGKCHSLRDPHFLIDISLEKEFLMDVVNYILDIFAAPMEIRLQHEQGRPRRVLSSNIRNALQITVNHHTQRFYLLRDYEPMLHFYGNVSQNSFNEEDFLEYCVCCTRQAILEYNRDKNVEAAKSAFDHLVRVLQRAKEDGKFTYLDKMDEAAARLIAINSERMAHRQDRVIAHLKRKSEESTDKEQSKKEAH